MVGSLKKVKIKEIIYKFREEKDGYYVYVPKIGQLISFNEVGFKIIEYISNGFSKDNIIDEFSAEYPQLGREIFESYVSNFFNELQGYKMI